jgi:hypothetical protein
VVNSKEKWVEDEEGKEKDTRAIEARKTRKLKEKYP